MKRQRNADRFAGESAGQNRNILKIFAGNKSEMRWIARKKSAEAREPRSAEEFARDEKLRVARKRRRPERGRLGFRPRRHDRLQEVFGLEENTG